MTTKNDWLTSNIQNRFINKNCDFDIFIDIKNYRKISFENAAEEICNELYSINKNIYISLSGGVDSEYVFKKFYSLGIPVTPVIVVSKYYEKETSIALNLCNSYNIKPHIINVTDYDIFSIFYKKIYKEINGSGIYAIPSFLVAEYAANNGGICIYGEHLLGDLDNKVTIELNEWDFYTNTSYSNTYNFFLYTPEIVYSMIKSINNENCQSFKCNLFMIPYRDKIRPDLSETLKKYFNNLIINRLYYPNHIWTLNPYNFLKKYFKEI
jgi:hypothetical protein